jgi:hypothetical protein
MKMELHALLDFFMRWTTTDASGYHYLFAARILSLSAFLDSHRRKIVNYFATSSQLAMSLEDPLPGKTWS